MTLSSKTVATPGNGSVPTWHADFLPMIPVIRRQVAALFRHLSPQERDEACAEVTAVAMIEFLGYRNGDRFGAFDPVTVASSAARNVLRSCRACGRESSRDVLSPTAQQRRRFKVEHLKERCAEGRFRSRIGLRGDRGEFARRQRDPAALIVANLYHAVRAFAQNAPQRDDITAVVIKVKNDTQWAATEQPGRLDSRGAGNGSAAKVRARRVLRER